VYVFPWHPAAAAVLRVAEYRYYHFQCRWWPAQPIAWPRVAIPLLPLPGVVLWVGCLAGVFCLNARLGAGAAPERVVVALPVAPEDWSPVDPT
jgi:hypothetical protein